MTEIGTFGNRSNSGYTYDNLNRMTASPGHSYWNDILGNRTYRDPQMSGAVRYVWDAAGRMTSLAGPSNGATYCYRADGMRTKKVTGLTLEWIDDEETASGYYDEHQDTNHPTWRYRYDGQMCMDEDFTTGAGGGSVTSSAYGLGARSIDMIRPFTVSGGTRSYGDTQFPIYDGHGNMKATLSRSGSSPWYAISNSRSYDVWGAIRDGSSTGDPNGRYCANLGHKQDDESGLIYMRARYYEPGTGRFISEDPARDGLNWYVYCGNEPVLNVDPSGKDFLHFTQLLLQAFLFIGGQILLGMWDSASHSIYRLTTWISHLESLLAAGMHQGGDVRDLVSLRRELNEQRAMLTRAKYIRGGQAILKYLGYIMIVKAFLMEIDWVDGRSALDLLFGGD